MKLKPTYQNNILTKDLQSIPDCTLFYEHVFDGLAPEPPIYKKLETIAPCKYYPEGDILIESMTFGQYGEVPGEKRRLGYTNESEKEWRVVPAENVEKMIGWLMATAQYFES